MIPSPTAADRTPYALDQPLPAEVVVARGAWLGYRRYPVFGWRWLRGRSLIFAAGIGAWAVLTGWGMGMMASDMRLGLLSGLHFFGGFILISCTGPLFATLVRHRGWPLRRERIAVVLAVLAGVVVAYFADTWASGYLEQAVTKAHGITAKIKPPEFSPFVKALVTTINVAFAVLIYAALGGGLALRAYFRELGRWQDSRQAAALATLQAEKVRSELRLGVLQAQVEPHFLFNTLASVRALVRQDPAQAEATLDALVDYLRASIPRLRDAEAAHDSNPLDATLLDSTLGQQLDLCASYLELMRLRTAGRLSHAIAVDPALREVPFPPLLLISLVENAVKHGIEPRPGPGTITLSAERDGDALRVRVIDDGLGLQPGVGGGLGLANVRAQLATHYGDRAEFTLRSHPPQGACAALRIPLDGDAR
jgi:signal transduction histidine kinase